MGRKGEDPGTNGCCRGCEKDNSDAYANTTWGTLLGRPPYTQDIPNTYTSTSGTPHILDECLAVLASGSDLTVPSLKALNEAL